MKVSARQQTSPLKTKKTIPTAEPKARLLPSGHGRNDLAHLVHSVFLAPGVKAPKAVIFSGLQRRSGSGSLAREPRKSWPAIPAGRFASSIRISMTQVFISISASKTQLD